jgi:ketosteroid isomerase-like protein
VQVLEDFRMAIINNDQEKASELLAEDARILESGGIETKEEYLSHHFHSDGKFLSAMEREVKSQKVKSNENTAWVSTVSHMSGSYNDREISVNSAELAVLVKTDEGWKISSVHWSSRSTE